MKLRKGDYVACKYRGHNGDLILGRVDSVRATGEVLLTNLLTKARSIKKTSVLLRRNQVISSWRAGALLDCFAKTKDIQAVREMAVTFRPAQKTKRPKKSGVKELIQLYLQLTPEGRKEFVIKILNKAEFIYGVSVNSNYTPMDA